MELATIGFNKLFTKDLAKGLPNHLQSIAYVCSIHCKNNFIHNFTYFFFRDITQLVASSMQRKLTEKILGNTLQSVDTVSSHLGRAEESSVYFVVGIIVKRG